MRQRGAVERVRGGPRQTVSVVGRTEELADQDCLVPSERDQRPSRGAAAGRGLPRPVDYPLDFQIAFNCDPPFAFNSDPASVRNDGAETGGAEPHIVSFGLQYWL